MNTKEIFQEVKGLNLPPGEYAITSSGPLGARGIREINDVDIIATRQLYERLKTQYGEETAGPMRKVVISPRVEVFGPSSFPDKLPGEPSLEEQISSAEIIAGLPFVGLDYVIFYKKQMGREKDLQDLRMIDEWKRTQNG